MALGPSIFVLIAASQPAPAVAAKGAARLRKKPTEAVLLHTVHDRIRAASFAALKNGVFSRFDSLKISLETLSTKSPQPANWQHYLIGRVARERSLSHLSVNDLASALAQNAAAIVGWNTPLTYNGQRKAESLLRSTNSLPLDQGGGLQPGWNHDAAIAQLVPILQPNKKSEAASPVLKEGLETYPDSVFLGELSAI
jgi:hypothetical protein